MTPLAINYPLSGDPWDCSVYPPIGSTYGDDLFNACTVPPGFRLEVVSQPTRGTVTFFGEGGAWGFALEDGTPGPDSFTYRVTNGSTHSNTATVSVQIIGE